MIYTNTPQVVSEGIKKHLLKKHLVCNLQYDEGHKFVMRFSFMPSLLWQSLWCIY